MQLQQVKQHLEMRGFHVVLFETAAQAAQYLDAHIDGTTVGIGGSVTVREMGLYDMLCTHNTVWWHNDPAQIQQYGADEIRRRAQDTEIYLSSVNGMSEDGCLVNIDNTGNRIASTVYGHKKAYLLVGCNKIAPTLEQAIQRARNIAAPRNARRFGANTPCAVAADKCYDCRSPARICRSLLISEAPTKGQETEIVLIGEPLGY